MFRIVAVMVGLMVAPAIVEIICNAAPWLGGVFAAVFFVGFFYGLYKLTKLF